MKQLINWYRDLPGGKQFAVSLILNFAYWLIAWIILEKIFFDENRSWTYHLFHAAWMALFMTILSDWKRFKSLFSKKREGEGVGK